MSKISDEEAMDCYKYLHKFSERDAIAKAEVAYTEEFRKIVKAQIMAELGDMSVAAKEMAALVDPRYLEAVEAYRDAVKLATQYSFLRAANEAKFSAWQTMSANNRVNIR